MFGIFFASLDTPEERNQMRDIYECYYGTMLSHAEHVLGSGYSKQDYEDAVHDALVSLINKPAEVFKVSKKSEDSLRAYLRTTVKNKCMDITKKRKSPGSKQQMVRLDAVELDLMSDDPDIDSQLLREEAVEMVQKHREEANLDEESNDILDMKFGHEMKREHIAEELGITMRRVDSKLQIAKLKIKKCIVEGGELVGREEEQPVGEKGKQ